MRRVFLRELMDACDAHDQVRRVVTNLVRAATAREVGGFLSFLDSRMEAQKRSLNLVVEEHGQGKKSGSVACRPMRAMVLEATKASRASGESDLLTITNLQKMLHYLIASLGSLRAWGELVGDGDAVLLFRNLTEDMKSADRELSEISENELWSRGSARSQGLGRDGDGRSRRGSTRLGRF